MSTVPAKTDVSNKDLQLTVNLFHKHGRIAAARMLNLCPPTIDHRMRKATALRIKPTIKIKANPLKALVKIEQQDKLAGFRQTIDSLIKQNKLLQGALDQARNAKMQVIPSRKQFTSRPDDESTVVIPDSHGKFMFMPAVMAFLADLKRLNPHRVIMLGDHVDCGGFLAQNHTWGYVAEADYTYEDDIKANNWFLDEIQKAAPRAHIEYLEGNHEARVERWCVTECLRSQKDSEFLRKNFAPEFLLRLKQRDIPYYRRSVHYDGLSVRGCIKRGQCFYLHELAGGRDAVNSHLRAFGGSVVFGHTHKAQSNITRTVTQNEIGAWSPGCLAQLSPLWQHSRMTDWTHGYSIQLHARSGRFLHLNIPIIKGESHFQPLAKHLESA